MSKKYVDNSIASWQMINDKLSNMKWNLVDTANELNAWIDEDARNKQSILRDKNLRYRDKLKKEWDRVKQLEEEYKNRIENQRKTADKNLKDTEANVWRESQIQAAKWWKTWKVSLSWQQALSHDISDSFAESLNKARQDKLSFDQWLDKSLHDLWIESVDKQHMLDQLANNMDTEEAQVMLDAIASKAANRKDFLKIFSAKLWEIQGKDIWDSYQRYSRDKRLKEEKENFISKSGKEREQYIRDSLSRLPTLTAAARDKIIQAMLKWDNPAKIISDLNTLKSKDQYFRTLASSSPEVASKEYLRMLGLYDKWSMDYKGWPSADWQWYNQNNNNQRFTSDSVVNKNDNQLSSNRSGSTNTRRSTPTVRWWKRQRSVQQKYAPIRNKRVQPEPRETRKYKPSSLSKLKSVLRNYKVKNKYALKLFKKNVINTKDYKKWTPEYYWYVMDKLKWMIKYWYFVKK